MQVSHNMAFCLAISIIVHHTIIQMFWAHDFWNNGPNTANRQRLDIKQTQWTVIDCVYFKKPWFDERFWHNPNSFTCQYNYFTFLSSSPLYLVLLQNTGLKFRKKTPPDATTLFSPLDTLSKSHPTVVWDNETQRQTSNGDGDTCAYTITHSI